MIEQICAFIHNFFEKEKYAGTYTIQNGRISLPFLARGQYFRIIGSRFNDGVHQYGYALLSDETFDGEIWDMRPPATFLRTVEAIEAWQAKYGDAVQTPYQSESFGGYSYTLKSGSTSGGQNDSAAGSWQGIFRAHLNQWRKLA